MLQGTNLTIVAEPNDRNSIFSLEALHLFLLSISKDLKESTVAYLMSYEKKIIPSLHSLRASYREIKLVFVSILSTATIAGIQFLRDSLLSM